MTRIPLWFASLLLAAPLLVQAQLRQPPPPTETRPVTLPSQSTPVTGNARPQREDADPPARTEDRPRPKPRSTPIAQPRATVRPIYDSKGQPAPHMRQTSPGRVIDTRTNRYYDTVPSGVGQQVVPPPAGSR